MNNWDDLRYVLAVARTGSLSRAARALGVNHATVLRHVAAFEASAGTEIFERTPRGYALRSEARSLVEAAQDVENAVLAVRRRLHGLQAPLHGSVRVSSTDSLCQLVLGPMLNGLRDALEHVKIVLLAQNQHADFTRLNADVAVRPAERLDGQMSGTMPARLGFALFEPVSGPAEGWLGLTEDFAHTVPARWMAENLPAGQVIARADSFLTLAAMAAGGLGRAILPVIVGEAWPALRRCPDGVGPMSVGLWVASHADLAEVPRIRRVRALLHEALERAAPRLAGISG